MKRSLKSLGILLASLFVMPFAVDAATMTYEDIPNDSYVIGTHVFTRDSGALTVKKIMLASRTIEGADLDSMEIIYKDIMGNLFEVSAGRNPETNKYPEAEVELTDEIVYEYYDLVEDLSETIIENAATIKSIYYNKFSNGDIITPDSEDFDDDSYYIYVGDYTSDETLEEITINDATYDNAEKYLSIGMNARVMAPVWKVESNKLYVATLWIAAESLPRKTTVITAGDQTYKFDAFDKDVSENSIIIKEVYSLFTRNGKVNTVTLDGTTITNVSSDGRHAIGVLLQNNGVDIVNSADLVYRLDQNGNMGMTTPETAKLESGGSESVTVTYATYPTYYSGEYPEGTEGKTLNLKIAIPGKGVINFTILHTPIQTPAED